MNIEEIKELLARFDQSTLTEFDLKEGTFGLYMNKNKGSQKIVDSTNQAVNTPLATADESALVQKENKTIRAAEESSKVSSKPDNTEAVLSPIVGIVYLKPAPDKENFKQIGDQVKKGEVICIVEAMKLMNEITATTDGTITEILVKNEDIVEFNQPLFHISKGV